MDSAIYQSDALEVVRTLIYFGEDDRGRPITLDNSPF